MAVNEITEKAIENKITENKMVISRDTYRKIKKMDHKQFNDWFVGLYDRAYKAGRREILQLALNHEQKRIDETKTTETPLEVEKEENNNE